MTGKDGGRRVIPGICWRLVALVLLSISLVWLSPSLRVAAAGKADGNAGGVRIDAVRAEPLRDGARIVLKTSRAISFDARVLAGPWRLEMFLPGVRAGKAERTLRAKGGAALVTGVRMKVVEGGTRVVFRLQAPVVIAEAYAVRRNGKEAARLVVRLARTDEDTLARLLDGGANADEEAARKSADAAGAGATAGGKPAGPLERVKAAYRRLVEEAAAPESIGDLLRALPASFTDVEEPPRGMRGTGGKKADESSTGGITAPDEKAGRHGLEAQRERQEEQAPGATARAPVIVLDAGHGGHDPGAIGVGGVREKEIVLDFVRTLREELKRRGYQVVMTRNSDRFLRLRSRVRVARRHGAQLFVSIHADKFRYRTVRGLGIYTLSERASDAEAAALAKMENAADLIGAPDDVVAEDEELRDILVDLVQRETNANSLLLARELVRDLKGVTRLRRNPVRSAPFQVLRAPEIPSLLIELGYVSNLHDVRNLTSRRWRAKVAARMARTIDRFLRTRLAWR